MLNAKKKIQRNISQLTNVELKIFYILYKCNIIPSIKKKHKYTCKQYISSVDSYKCKFNNYNVFISLRYCATDTLFFL